MICELRSVAGLLCCCLAGLLCCCLAGALFCWKGENETKQPQKTKKPLNSTPNGVRGAPKSIKKSVKNEKMLNNAKSGYQMAPKTPLPKTSRRFLAIFGYPLGAQKSPKIDFFPKKPSQGALFHRFLRRMSFASIFRLIFS